jgi:hypothetical protein
MATQLRKHLKKNREESDTIVKELIDPANVLIPMSTDGAFGFGHLRYQEYLVAWELMTNRAIQIGEHLEDAWWKGVYILFAKMSKSIEWMILDLAKHGYIERSKANISAMIRSRPINEHEMLFELLNSAIRAEQTDGGVEAFYDTSDGYEELEEEDYEELGFAGSEEEERYDMDLDEIDE